MDSNGVNKKDDSFDFQIGGKASSGRTTADVRSTEDKVAASHASGRSDRSDERSAQESPRRPANQRENSFNVLAWLAEGATGVFEELRHSDLGLGEEFWKHAYAAQRESLLAAQSLLNQLVERTQEQERKEEERQQRRARRGDINIDF